MAHANVALNFNVFLEKTKLKDDGSNYTDWVRNLRIILIAAKKAYVLEAPLGEAPVFPATQDVMNAWQSRSEYYSLVQCGMLYSLEPGLQKRFEKHGSYEMFEELKMVFQAHAQVERYEVSDKFFSCKMEENSSVSEHILRMSGLHNRLSQLGVNLPDDAVVDKILQSLPPSYKSFVMNFNMQGMEKTIHEVYSMLKSAEVEVRIKPLSSRRARVRRTSRRTARELPRPVSKLPGTSQRMDPSPRLSVFITREVVTGSGTAPNI